MESDEIYTIILELADEPNDYERTRSENKYLHCYGDLYYVEGLDYPSIKHVYPEGADNPLNTFVFDVIYDDMASDINNLTFYSIIGIYYIFCFLFQNGFNLTSLHDKSNPTETAANLFQELFVKLHLLLNSYHQKISQLQEVINSNQPQGQQLAEIQMFISYYRDNCIPAITDLITFLNRRWVDEQSALEEGGEIPIINCEEATQYRFANGNLGVINIGAPTTPEFLIGTVSAPHPLGAIPDDPGDDEYGAAGGGKCKKKQSRKKKRK